MSSLLIEASISQRLHQSMACIWTALLVNETQFSGEEFVQSRHIAEVCIHVERAISCIKHQFLSLLLSLCLGALWEHECWEKCFMWLSFTYCHWLFCLNICLSFAWTFHIISWQMLFSYSPLSCSANTPKSWLTWTKRVIKNTKNAKTWLGEHQTWNIHAKGNWMNHKCHNGEMQVMHSHDERYTKSNQLARQGKISLQMHNVNQCSNVGSRV